MLQPRELSKIRKYQFKNNLIKFLTIYPINNSKFFHKICLIVMFLILSLMGCMGETKENERLILVSPTPTLVENGADDITTVLLINNESGRAADSHGRFLTVRPDVGILTSTARTFVQDGITTEFATKVVGTTLNSGRLYAQYIKKNSRVVNNNDKLAPSIVTSWVGELQNTQTPIYLQNHNDLFNFNEKDWQDIDDSLLVKQDEFVGNTDFVIVQTTKVLQSTMSNNQELINTFPTILNIRTKLNTDHSNSLLKLTDDKVLTINDLETFTVINKINPTPYPHRKMSTELFIPNADKKKEQERNGKFVNNQNSIASDFHISKRILATTTYYGFAEFTTVVGNSVIVFSPSTLQINPSFGNVTSIKGNPTLRPDSTKIQTSQDVSVITNPKGITNKNTFDILANDVSQLKSMTYSGDFSSISETDIQANQINISKLYIEESISNLYLGYIQSNTSKLEDVVPTGAHYIPLRNESRLHILEGATTVFVDDDPFTNFMDLIRTSDPILNRSHLTINETSYIPTTLNGNEINNSFIELNINKNYDIKTCDHTTSQVFLTQIVKRLNDSLVNSTNPLQDYNIVETTKYYCIQATQVKSKAEIKDVTAFQNTESSGELMSTEVDETTLRDPEEYNLTTDNEYDGVDDEYDIGTDDIDLIFKTLFTTYTYLTTFFEGSQTTLSSHTEIITNIVSSTYASNFEDKSENLNIKEGYQFTERVNDQTKYALPQEIISLLVSYSSVNSSECDSSNEATQLIDDLKYTKTFFTTYTYYTSIFTHNETEVMSRTEVITNYATDNKFNVSTSNMLLLSQKRENKIHTPFINSSSLDIKNKDNKKDYHEDQVSSESNTDEILPSATLLLQTSFTTFTFYTTMYVGEDINVISRLETVTNVATETLQPTKTFKLDEVSFPITYFTTFTYWTKLAKDGNISTISREETLSNVIQATSTTTEAFNNKSFKNKMSSIIFHANISQGHGELEENANSSLNGLNILSDITTYYTTYTYYTTSYEVNNTIIDSRFETITNIITTSGTFPSIPSLELSVSQTDLPLPKTDYPIQPNTHNLILYDCKHIIDADEVSTLYFTTEIFSSENSEGYDIEITSSTSRLQIDETKKSILATKSENSLLEESLNMLHKTGLVRLIEGTRIQNSTTTLYQSKVIGTLINNRYAQIIESTSSLLFEKLIADNSISTSIVEPTIGIENNETNEAIILEEHSTSMEIGDIKNDKFPIDSPQTTKRIFAPVIRPFASRNRPTFAPKQKTQSPISATIITRSDITPTITATPALKSIGRYSSSRRVALLNSSNYLNESSTQLSRRHFGRPTKPSSFSNENNLTYQSSLFSQTKNRFSSSLRATPVLTTRRQSISYRPSNNAGFRGSGISLNSKLRIRPTSLETVQSDGLTQSETYIREGVSDVSTEEENSTDRIFNISNEEESTKRIQNPLLRFRRPINKPSGFLPSSRTSNGNFQASSIRHNPLLARSKISALNSTATTTTKSVTRNVYRPNVLQPRSRPQSNLFPPRGLFQPQSKEENSKYLKKQNDSDNDSDNDSVYNEEEADEFNDRNEDDGKIHLTERSSQVVARRKISTRVRRQAETINRSRFRFRHQNVTMPILREDERLSNPEVMDEFTSNFRGKSNSRFGSKFPSLRGQQMYSQSILVNSTTLTHHKTIRPTRPTSKRPQFTLREKDTSPNRARSTNNFRRQSTKGNSSVRRPVGSKTGTSTSHRIKNYNSYNNNGDSGRLSSTPRSRIGNNNVSKRGRGSIRSRNRNEYATDMQPLDQEDAIITVTHFIPVEVTIPVVNGHVTDYKNIVTAKTSIELIGPNQYTDVVGTNGLKSTYLNRDETTINAAGLTELTKYLLHEVITSTVTFTPTTIRGRKTSFSHILPSTAYSVEYVVSTIQPQISANAPLANILLSQLLLGNLNLGTHPIIGALGQQNALSSVTPTLADPVTEYRTHTSTYVTTIFDGRSTIIPVTFQGKKILTTVYDTTAQTITATEYSIDTIVNTPTIAQNMQSAGTVNSLLLQQLLQQEQFSLPQHNLKILPDHIMLSENLQDLEVRTTEKSDIIDEVEYASKSNDPPNSKNNRKKSRKGSDGQKRNKQHKYDMTLQDSSVVTLYISGRRPGEFSTVLSTIQKVVDHSASLQKREVNFETQTTVTLNKSKFIYNAEDGVINISEFSKDVMSNPLNDLNGGTASLESIVGDVHFWYAQSNKKSVLQTRTGYNKTLKRASISNRFVTDIVVSNGLVTDEARYNFATHMSNGVELIIASEKERHAELYEETVYKNIGNLSQKILIFKAHHKPMTLAPSTLKNQMILTMPHINQELNISESNKICKTLCLTTYTYTTYTTNKIISGKNKEPLISKYHLQPVEIKNISFSGQPIIITNEKKHTQIIITKPYPPGNPTKYKQNIVPTHSISNNSSDKSNEFFFETTIFKNNLPMVELLYKRHSTPPIQTIKFQKPENKTDEKIMKNDNKNQNSQKSSLPLFENQTDQIINPIVYVKRLSDSLKMSLTETKNMNENSKLRISESENSDVILYSTIGFQSSQLSSFKASQFTHTLNRLRTLITAVAQLLDKKLFDTTLKSYVYVEETPTSRVLQSPKYIPLRRTTKEKNDLKQINHSTDREIKTHVRYSPFIKNMVLSKNDTVKRFITFNDILISPGEVVTAQADVIFGRPYYNFKKVQNKYTTLNSPGMHEKNDPTQFNHHLMGFKYMQLNNQRYQSLLERGTRYNYITYDSEENAGILNPPPPSQKKQQFIILRTDIVHNLPKIGQIQDNLSYPYIYQKLQKPNKMVYGSQGILNSSITFYKNKIFDIFRVPQVYSTSLPTESTILKISKSALPVKDQEPLYDVLPTTLSYTTNFYLANQSIQVKKNSISHAINMHAPPLKFKKEINYFSKPVVVNGQILMPEIVIPMNQKNVDLQMTPRNKISLAIGTSHTILKSQYSLNNQSSEEFEFNNVYDQAVAFSNDSSKLLNYTNVENYDLSKKKTLDFFLMNKKMQDMINPGSTKIELKKKRFQNREKLSATMLKQLHLEYKKSGIRPKVVSKSNLNSEIKSNDVSINNIDHVTVYSTSRNDFIKLNTWPFKTSEESAKCLNTISFTNSDNRHNIIITLSNVMNYLEPSVTVNNNIYSSLKKSADTDKVFDVGTNSNLSNIVIATTGLEIIPEHIVYKSLNEFKDLIINPTEKHLDIKKDTSNIIEHLVEETLDHRLNTNISTNNPIILQSFALNSFSNEKLRTFSKVHEVKLFNNEMHFKIDHNFKNKSDFIQLLPVTSVSIKFASVINIKSIKNHISKSEIDKSNFNDQTDRQSNVFLMEPYRDEENHVINNLSNIDQSVFFINSLQRINLKYNNSLNTCRPACKSYKNEICVNPDSINKSLSFCGCRPSFGRIFPDRPCKPTYSYEIHIQANWHGLNGNLLSKEYQQIGGYLLEAIDRMIRQSDYRDVHHGTMVKNIFFTRNNTIRATLLLQFSENRNEKEISSILKKHLRQSNYSIGGTDFFTSKTGPDSFTVKDFDECAHENFHDCSVNAICFNMIGSFTCSCKDGYTDITENMLYPGRHCSDNIIGCDKCNYNGKCVLETVNNTKAILTCECNPWYAGTMCHVNIKVLLIFLITSGTSILIFILCCIQVTYKSKHKIKSKKNKQYVTNLATSSQYMVTSNNNPNILSDSSAESSIVVESLSQKNFKGIEKLNLKRFVTTDNNVLIKNIKTTPNGPACSNFCKNENSINNCINEWDQKERSLTFMIPRAKFRMPYVSQHTSCNSEDNRSMIEEIQQSSLKNVNIEYFYQFNEANSRKSSTKRVTPISALVSEGFEVSTIVKNKVPSTLAEETAQSITKPIIIPESNHEKEKCTIITKRDKGSIFLLPHTHLYKPESLYK